MSTAALILAATLTTSGSVTSTINAYVWPTLKLAASGGNAAVAPSGELTGLASLVAAGQNLSTTATGRVGGDAASASVLVGSLRSRDEALGKSGVVVGSDSALLTTGAEKDSFLEKEFGVRMLASKPGKLAADVTAWLESRLTMGETKPASFGSRVLAGAAMYVVPAGAGIFPVGTISFDGHKVPAAVTTATLSLENETAQIALAPIGTNSKFALVFALPAPGKTPGDVLDEFGSKWNETLASLKKGDVTVTLPIFKQAVDRDVTSWLGLKGEDALTARERLYVAIGVEPPPPPKKANQAGGGVGLGGGVWMPIWHPMAPLNVPTSYGVGGGQKRSNQEPATLNLNRAFVYALADTSTGQVVFAGVYANP
ncbi:hypothetical protein [Fimbriimonas ginsengisoli]|uniref:Serpin domain-containing protein n=1 Tax=Fimbriimonas ginsengisoli Gsoil 348 TaxID=661478 RepID=A0A068NWP3_FIMGI|nr:hypothetical protein [Fimbriimonas ginsengisoli]AIE87866.1 hypothetical protein OP10G_4498 [Fimbriimonas ginsengisoli Gsoil 348]